MMLSPIHTHSCMNVNYRFYVNLGDKGEEGERGFPGIGLPGAIGPPVIIAFIELKLSPRS